MNTQEIMARLPEQLQTFRVNFPFILDLSSLQNPPPLSHSLSDDGDGTRERRMSRD